MILVDRNHVKGQVHDFHDPSAILNVGLWSLFLGASALLGARLWVKITRRHGLWYDDYILIASWGILLANNSIIVHEFATGYVLEDSTKKWDDRMHILINISSCGTLIGQALSKTAFAVTLLRMVDRNPAYFLWFCIVTMNAWMVSRCIFQWAKLCGEKSYQQWYRLDFCIEKDFREPFKEGGNIYNIIMDFFFAGIPWWVTRKLEMKRVEKIGLCITMSLGMIVAIVAAVRVGWKGDGNDRDEWYIYRNGQSQVWYSSEITGTIMVQCIPILRPILREFTSSITSKRLGSSANNPSSSHMGKGGGSQKSFGSKLSSSALKPASLSRSASRSRSNSLNGGGGGGGGGSFSLGDVKQNNDRIALREIPEEGMGPQHHQQEDSWPLPPMPTPGGAKGLGSFATVSSGYNGGKETRW